VNAVTSSPSRKTKADGLRPIDIRHDLPQLADLIEIVFRDTMDESGRAAIREMRYLSQMGLGWRLLSGLPDAALGMGQGYVWIEDGKLVGNSSIYPANWPRHLGEAWLIANVGTHPEYRRKGIARQLVLASMELIRRKGAEHAILQVDYDNQKAINLYEELGFVRERAFTLWSRSALVTGIPLPNAEILVSQPRSSEWQALYHLAEAERPNERGGLAWLKPLHPDEFRASLWKSLTGIFSLNNTERLIVRDTATQEISAYLAVERSFVSRSRLILIRKSGSPLDYAQALLGNALRRYNSSGFMLEHPYDDTALNPMLEEMRFRPSRSIWHMRYSY
jgi:ribosomal protein S18 acetylase RimI-like enzyme